MTLYEMAKVINDMRDMTLTRARLLDGREAYALTILHRAGAFREIVMPVWDAQAADPACLLRDRVQAAFGAAPEQNTDMPYVIAVDFDGCLCDSHWPELGEPIPEVIAELKRRQREGCKIILWTCRVGKPLRAACAWCEAHGLQFDAVNDNLPELKAKFGANPRKITADEYWDDRSVPRGLTRRTVH